MQRIVFHVCTITVEDPERGSKGAWGINEKARKRAFMFIYKPA